MGIEMLGILKIMCEVIDGQQAGRKSDSQITWLKGILNCKPCSVEDHRSDSTDANQSNVNILDYFRSCAKTEAEKEASRSITQSIHSEFSDDFIGIGCFEGTFKQL